MPQAPRKDNQVQRAQDKESKRARGALSCAECRRLKLKCDKTVPCSSCKRRGCSAICPNGSLITGQGTRFVLADTETLHQKIAYMSDRIRQLEDALAILQSTVTGPGGEPHPLLHRDLLKVKSSIELHSASGSGGPEDVTVGEEEEDADAEYIDAFGTLAIRDDGAATFYGRSAGSESLLIGESSTTPPSSAYPSGSSTDHGPSPPPHYLSTNSSYSNFHNPSQTHVFQQHPDAYSQQHLIGSNGNDPSNLQVSVASLASAFPLAPSLSQSSSGTSALSSPSSFSSSSVGSSLYRPQVPITLQILVTNFLPPYVEALRLTQSYLELAPWFFGAVTGRQIEGEILPLWYEEAAAPAAPTPPGGLPTAASAAASPSSSGKQQRAGTSHDLALLFVLCCFGALNDINLPAAPDNALAEKFYQLTKAALSLDPGGASGADPKSSRNGVLERPPSVSTVQTLSLMAIYEGMCSGENSIETTWALMGLACKLAQSIGLHRDCARWKLTPAEVQKRRALFWELFITDCWQSLATGRLATFSLPFVDCELPSDPDQTIADDGSIQPSFPYWKARFGAECVSAVVQGTLTSRAPKYSIILDLDRKVRDMELPAYAQGPPPQGLGLAQTMSHFMPQNYRELTLLYIHRCFFAHAISSNPLDPIKSQYAPSFLAGYRSACTIVASVRQQFSMFPAQIARFWVLWTHAFSASVMLASVATHSSRSKTAPAALLELKTACDLFETASAYGGRAVKFLPILRRLQMKAQQAFRDANNGIPPSIPNDIFKPSQPDENKDEFSIFSGKTHTVSTKSNPPATSSHSTAVSSAGSGKSSRSASDSPGQMFTDNPSFANVHPSLVSELNTFHGHIKTQIQNAYRSGGDLFGGGPMVVDPSSSSRALSKLSVEQQQAQAAYQQQQQAQAMYQQQQANYKQQIEQQERLERERMEAERRETLELERQELARKQQLQQQHEIQRQYAHQQEIQRQQQLQQQEIQRQQQQELQRQQQAHQEAIQQQQQQRQIEIQRQQEKLQQQQRQEQYRQQLETQQQQVQQQHMAQYHQQAYETEPSHAMYTAVAPPVVHSIPVSSAPSTQVPTTVHHQRHPSHRQSQLGIQQTYQQPPQQHYQSLPHHPVQVPQPSSSSSLSHSNVPHSQHSIPPQHTGLSEPQQPHIQVVPQQQHSMYTIPPDYSHHPNPETVQIGNSSVNYTAPPAPSYGQPSVPPTSSVPYVSDTYKYWPAAPTSFAMPDQQATSTTYAAGPGPSHHQHYTPENALRGIAADDRSLQETWQSYMTNVGSPRQFFED